jgi:hypothetical protein
MSTMLGVMESKDTIMITIPKIRTPENKWIDGVCSKCGALGVFWDGGKRTEHYCVKCLVIIAR